MTEPYEAEVFLNPNKRLKPVCAMADTTSLIYEDLVTYTHEGPDGWYRAGIARMSLENADHRLIHESDGRRMILEETSEREDSEHRNDEYLELKKDDKLILQWRYDGLDGTRDSKDRRARVYQAGLYAEQDEP